MTVGCVLMQAERVLLLASRNNIAVQNTAIHDFSRAGGRFLISALELYRSARESGVKVSKASVSQLIAACISAGDEHSAEQILLEAGGDLDGALDLVHGLARQALYPAVTVCRSRGYS